MSLDEQLQRELEALDRAGRRRRLEPAAARGELVDFTSNDYLGLARDPGVVAAAAESLRAHGAGGRAARLLGGGGAEVAMLEREVADWLGAEAALAFPSGYQACVGVVTALVGRGDVVLSDRLVHASLIDGVRLSRADVRVHEHLDVDHAARLLRVSRSARRRVVLTEGVFSMDGDSPDLAALARICEQEGAWLIVDEAHAAGLLGPEGGGAVAGTFGRALPPCLAARIVTGGKAFGAQGALVVGSSALRDVVANRARSFVFTTAAAPPVVGALRAAMARARRDPALRARPLALARRLAAALGLPEPAAAIVPVPVGGERAAVDLQRSLAAAGVDVRAIRPPTVPPGTCRLRVVCRADHEERHIDALADALLARWSPPEPGPTTARAAYAWFVCGTDTGIGKTVVSGLLLRALVRRGGGDYWKPVQTGSDDDTAEVARLAGVPAGGMQRPRFWLPLPASPHEAARDAGVRIELAELDTNLESLRAGREHPVVVELAGGLLVPYGDGHLQIDWLAARRPRIALVAKSGLGTLNHTLLSLEALRRRGLEVDALFLVGDPHPSNAATLRELGGVRLTFELPRFASLGIEALDAWLDEHGCLAELFER